MHDCNRNVNVTVNSCMNWAVNKLMMQRKKEEKEEKKKEGNTKTG